MSALAVSTRPAAQSSNDHELVAAVRDGDDRAFEMLFERYQARVAGHVRSMVRDHGRAEDITQEVFIAALRRIRATDREIAFKAWIFEIAKNACIDAFRRGRNIHEVSFDADDALGPADQWRLTCSGSGPDAVMESKLALDDLCGAFGGLSQTHHDILVMREFDGLSYREIGEQLGMTQGAVESTLFRARRRLGEEYEEIASGERCARVRGIVDATSGRALSLREHSRMRRHVSHCQPCRRYALLAGVDIGAAPAPASIARVAALLPLPAFLRRRPEIEQAGQLFAPHPQAVSVVSVLDPVAVSSWGKAIFAAATIAAAGLGSGAAVDQRDPLADMAAKAPAFVVALPDRTAVTGGPSAAVPEPVPPLGSQQPTAPVDSLTTPSALDPNADDPADDGPPVAQRSKDLAPAPTRSSSVLAPPAPGAAQQEAALSGKNTAVGEPIEGPLHQVLGDEQDGAADANESGRPEVVKAVVGLLKRGGATAGAGDAPDTSGSVNASDAVGPDAAPASQDARPRPLAKLKPIKVVREGIGALTAGPE